VHDASSKFDATRFNDMPVAVGERAATLSCARLFEVASGGIAMVRPLSADAAEKSRSFCGIRGAACCRAPSMDSAGAYRTNQEGW
jgi:hypothetical protein